MDVDREHTVGSDVVETGPFKENLSSRNVEFYNWLALTCNPFNKRGEIC